MERRRRLCLARVDERRQFLDLEHDPVRGVHGLLRGVGDDERDRLADVANSVARQHRVHYRHEVGVAPEEGERVGLALEVGSGEDGADARCRLRRLGVDPAQVAVRVDAAHEGGVEHVGELHVADVPRLALEEALVFEPRERLTDPTAHDAPRAPHPSFSRSQSAVSGRYR